MPRKSGLIFVSTLFIPSFLIWQAVFVEVSTPYLEVNFFDVGEGDSILIEIPGGNQILIDGGPNGEVVEKVASKMPFFDRRIEFLISTHPDNDHITGLFEVLNTFEVSKVLIPRIEGEEDDAYSFLKEAAKDREIEVVFAQAGQEISFSDYGKFLILWPKENFASSQTNDFSVVGKLSFGKIDFLFTGDAPSSIESELLAGDFSGDFSLESEILKVSHHGSKYSTSQYFLEEVSPKAAIISVGENSYDHPAKEVLQNLESYGIKTLRTDENGDIKIISDGETFEVIINK